MPAASEWRLKHRKLQYVLLLGLIATSAIIVYWDLGTKIPTDSLQLDLQIGSVSSTFITWNGRDYVASVVKLELQLHNPLEYATPGILLESPHIYVQGARQNYLWGTQIYASYIDCLNGTRISITGPAASEYVALCGTLNPVIIGPNQTLVLPINVTLSPENFGTDDWAALQNQNVSFLLLGFLTVRLFFSSNYSPAPPDRYSATDCGIAGCFWMNREFKLYAVTKS